jgi:methylthioribose-1-phosphate isomerase
LRLVHGLDGAGHPGALRQLPADEAVANPAFDVTPASLVSALISERGTCAASRDGLLTLYPEERDG